MGLFESIAEEIRSIDAAASTGKLGRDDRFWRSFAYAFRLRVGNEETVFPLVINPKTYRKSHPFALEVTPTQEGGVYLEEQGIIVSEITLEGHTGFKPRVNSAETGAPPPLLPLSGQAHFFRLQDLCFTRYSELKKDPEVAPTVTMLFSNFKDNEHWIVAPVEFALDRDVGTRVLYNYKIQLKVLGAVIDAAPLPSEDETVLEAIGNALSSIVKGEATIDGALLDLVGVEGDLDSIAGTVSATHEGLTRITGRTRDFIRRTKRTIALPFATIASAQQDVLRIQDLLRDAVVIPLDIVQLYQGIEDALDTMGAYPDVFVEPFSDQAEAFLRLTQGPATSSADDLEGAAESQLTQSQSFRSSALRPGDLVRVLGGIFQQSRSFPTYEGFREVVTIFGDTLQKLAARELNDARRWVDLALANDLQAPYISDEGLPGTLRPGDSILVPTTARGGDDGTVHSAGDPDLRASQSEAVYGRDLELVFDNEGRADLRVDTAGGSTDFRTVSGVPNLEQAILVIISTEKGTNILYLNVGYDRIVGQRGTFERVLAAQLSVAEAIQRDPRILRTRGVDFATVEDALNVEIDAVIVDNTQARVIGRILS